MSNVTRGSYTVPANASEDLPSRLYTSEVYHVGPTTWVDVYAHDEGYPAVLICECKAEEVKRHLHYQERISKQRLPHVVRALTNPNRL